MSSKWHQKKEKLALQQFERDLLTRPDDTTKELVNEIALGGGDEKIFEKKLSKEEKKARAKAAREAKRLAKKQSFNSENGDDDDEDNDEDTALKAQKVLEQAVAATQGGDGTEEGNVDDGIDHEAADALAAAGTICTFASSRKGVDARSRDINVTNFTLQHMGAVLLDETEIVLNHGNRYGLVGRNGK